MDRGGWFGGTWRVVILVFGGAASALGLSATPAWTGCGRVTLGPDAPGRMLTFDAKTGARVGIEDSSDVSNGACMAFQYAYGTTLEDCDEIDSCVLCGAAAARTCR